MEVLSGSSDSSTCRNSSVGFSERSIEPQKDWLIVVLTAIPTLIIVIGTIAGNVLVCVAIGHSRQLRKNITNAFCASLAISDLLLGLFVLPISFGRTLTDQWTLGAAMCNIYISMDVFLSTASILNLFTVTLDRYYAITKPLLYPSIITKRTATAMLSLVWLLSAAIGFLPINFGWNTDDSRIQNYACPSECDFAVESLAYSLTIALGTFFLPLLILYAMYSKILTISYAHVKAIRAQTTLYSQFADGVRNDKQSNNRNTLVQHRATLTLFIICFFFSICWLPYFFLFSISPRYAMSTFPLMADIFLWMGYFNSFVNPFVYGLTNREYRAAFKSLLCRWGKPEHDYPPINSGARPASADQDF